MQWLKLIYKKLKNLLGKYTNRFVISRIKNKFHKISYSFFKIYFFFKPNTKAALARKYVIGVSEIGNNIYYLGKLLDDSYTICLTANKYYQSNQYDFCISDKISRSIVKKELYPRVLLGYLAHLSEVFVYFWQSGFLGLDREKEFRFLKNKGKKIVCIFVGSDIRSIKKTIEYYDTLGIDHWTFYYAKLKPNVIRGAYDAQKLETAQQAENYADLILSSESENTSYLKVKPSNNLGYIITDDMIRKYEIHNKHQIQNEKILIVHGASSPVIKGTSLVRAAVKNLREKGYDFEFIEAFDLKNDEMIQLLFRADILVYQFYEVMPGLMGIEGLITENAVMMSAEFDSVLSGDELQKFINTPPWLVTKYWQITEHLQYLMDNPNHIQFYKKNAQLFTKQFCNSAYQKQRVEILLDI